MTTLTLNTLPLGDDDVEMMREFAWIELGGLGGEIEFMGSNHEIDDVQAIATAGGRVLAVCDLLRMATTRGLEPTRDIISTLQRCADLFEDAIRDGGEVSEDQRRLASCQVLLRRCEGSRVTA